MKLDFIIIGAQKSGTSSLAYQLSQHPQICFCKVKEPHYFSKSKDWKKEITDYHKFFEPVSGQLCGEASTSYTFLPQYSHTPSRLFEYNPELKLIYIMRQPVERIISHYMHKLAKGRAKNPPEIDVLIHSHYMNVSRYRMQLEPYLRLFPGKNILLLIFEEFISNPSRILGQIALFLGVDPGGLNSVDAKPKNVGIERTYLKRFPGSRLAERLLERAPGHIRKIAQKYLYFSVQNKIELPDSVKQTLWRSLENDVLYIEELLGRRLDIWRNGYTK
jgi:hypothetical protein